MQQHSELANEFDRLNSIGVKILLSNSNSEYVKSLYEKHTILKVKTQRNINCDAKRRRDHHDLIVTNFTKNKNTKKKNNKVVRKLNKKKIIASSTIRERT